MAFPVFLNIPTPNFVILTDNFQNFGQFKGVVQSKTNQSD
ncbi:hypothetical protein PSE_2266 [Pseudovibrio sp. FO-BEG1]|nr:hypothetical protein PSE_2266 [Pseudovibrio sp. FO-BEG1]